MLQSSAHVPEPDGDRDLALFAGYYERPRDVDQVIDLVGLAEKRDARVRTLSGGQKRRLDLGLGLIGDPEILFLDEPTTGFDPAARRAAWDVIRSLRSLGKTILLTTHYLDEAEQLSDRVAVLREGADRRDRAAGGAVGRGAGDRDPLPPRRRGDPGLHPRADARPARADRARRCRRGASSRALTVRRPTLEEVYLALTEDDDGVSSSSTSCGASSASTGGAASSPSSPSSSRSLLFVLLGSVYGNDRIKSRAQRQGLRVPARRDARLRRRLDRVRRARDRARPPPRERDPQAAARDAAAAGRPTSAAVIASTVLVFAIEAAALIVLARVAVRRAASRTHWLSLVLALLLGALVVRGARDRAHRADPLRRGLVRGRERDLPADGVPLRLVLVDRTPTRASSR